MRVLTRKEANRSRAIKEGNARPNLWGVIHPSTVCEWQSWAFVREQSEWKRSQRLDDWSLAISPYYRNHERNKAIHREVAKRRYHRLKHTPQFKVKHMMRNILSRIARKVSFRKTQRTHEYLGCTIDHARRHIEKQFRKGMSWDNHGEWELDHIIPLAKWDLTNPQHIKRANHYSNLQPLWKQENRAKGARLIGKHQMALL